MSSIGSIAFASMQSAANSIAKAGSDADLADKIVRQAAAQANVSISLKMIRAEAQATQQMLDILA